MNYCRACLYGLLVAALMAGALLLHSKIIILTSQSIYLSSAFLTGVVAGFISLFARFSTGLNTSDLLLKSLWVYAYVIVHGLAAVVAAYLAVGAPEAASFKSAILGASYALIGLAALKSSLTLDNGKEIGPAVVLEDLSRHISARIDGATSVKVWSKASSIMKDVDFLKAKDAVGLSAQLMRENYTEADKKRFAEDITRLENLQGQAASILLGIIVARVVGVDGLRELVRTLGDDLKWTRTHDLDSLEQAIYATLPG